MWILVWLDFNGRKALSKYLSVSTVLSEVDLQPKQEIVNNIKAKYQQQWCKSFSCTERADLEAEKNNGKALWVKSSVQRTQYTHTQKMVET